MSNLLKRAIAGAVYVIVVSICLYLGSFYWLGLMSIFLLIALYEFFKPLAIDRNSMERTVKCGLIFIWFLAIATYHYYAQGVFSDSHFLALPLGYFAYFLLLIPLVFLLVVIEISKGAEAKFGNAQVYIFALIYLGMGFLSLAFLRHDVLIVKEQSQSLIFAFACLAGVWVSDTFAYIFGKFFGKNKMTPISPNKTWEGLVGGMLLTAIFELLFLTYYNDVALWYDAVIYGFLLSIVSTFGDLFQSLWKRSLGLKDSGKLIPGHGGILDRIDSQLLAAPFTIAFWAFIHNFFV